MRNTFAISSALAAHLLFIIPLISPSYSATTTTQVQKGDSFWQIAQSHGVTVESLQAANLGISTYNLYVGQTINVPVVDDVPAVDDMVSTPVFASGSPTAKVTASVTSSNDVPAMSDMVTGPIVLPQTAGAIFQVASEDVPAMSDMVTGPIKAATPTTLVTSSKPWAEFFCRSSSSLFISTTLHHPNNYNSLNHIEYAL